MSKLINHKSQKSFCLKWTDFLVQIIALLCFLQGNYKGTLMKSLKSIGKL